MAIEIGTIVRDGYLARDRVASCLAENARLKAVVVELTAELDRFRATNERQARKIEGLLAEMRQR